MKKNGDANNNPVLVIVLGLIFAIGGIACLAMLTKGFSGMLLTIGLILTPIGILFIVYGIMRAKKVKAYKTLLNNPNAHITEARFVKATMSSYTSKSFGVGGISVPTSVNVYKKIHYSYTDENGMAQTGKSVLSYTPNQVEYLQNKGMFKIKCKGKLSAIVEEIPAQNANFNI
ncbi:MAG: hypothetical protein IJ415_02260 [Clostridia bacterium]|nr:hypothetical protein [Clostridia bacterium]